MSSKETMKFIKNNLLEMSEDSSDNQLTIGEILKIKLNTYIVEKKRI